MSVITQIWDSLKRLILPKRPVKPHVEPDEEIIPTGNVFNMWEYKVWGKLIIFSDFQSRRITGNYRVFNVDPRLASYGMNAAAMTINFGSKKPTHLSVGDELRAKMQSGKIARFLISEIRYERDPADMFFGKVIDLGYLEEGQP